MPTRLDGGGRAAPSSPTQPSRERSVPRVITASEHDREDYIAFGNVETRNGLQERIEIPLLIRALSLPKGQRILEVGCGRGIAESAGKLVSWSLSGWKIRCSNSCSS